MAIEWLPYEFKWKPGDLNSAAALGGAASATPRLANVVCGAWDLPA